MTSVRCVDPGTRPYRLGLDDVEPDEGLIFGHDDATGCCWGCFLVTHDVKPTVLSWWLLCAGLAEWQTRSTQNALLERACEFESRIRHNGEIAPTGAKNEL